MTKINIFINQDKHEIEDTLTISGLLEYLKIPHTRGSAIAVNNRVISKSSWDTFTFNEGDKIIFIKATQGG